MGPEQGSKKALFRDSNMNAIDIGEERREMENLGIFGHGFVEAQGGAK